MSRKPCGRPIVGKGGGISVKQTCPYERAPGLQRCRWHWLMAQPADVQSAHADKRLDLSMRPGSTHRARVPESEWPPGERWCAGCQSFVPLFYCSGSRCKACASRAAHASRVQSLYGLPKGDYEKLLEFQGGVCYICGRTPRKIRLAVDHDHRTGEPRGLLCANNENGCNRAVVANLENSPAGLLEAARRLLAYAERSPYDQMRGLEPGERVIHVTGDGQRTQYLPPPF